MWIWKCLQNDILFGRQGVHARYFQIHILFIVLSEVVSSMSS